MHDHSAHRQVPGTSGKVLHWVAFYDALAFVLTLGRERSIRRETVERAGISAGESVLDVGCGTGSLTLAAKAAAGAQGRVCGIDPSPEMIEFATRKAARAAAQIDLRLAVVEDLPFPDASFDVVLSSLMLHHLPEDVKRKGFAEIARVLRPGGRFFAVDLAGGSHPGSAAHLGAFLGRRRQRGLQPAAKLLEAAGFGEVSTGQMKFRALAFLSGRRIG